MTTQEKLDAALLREKELIVVALRCASAYKHNIDRAAIDDVVETINRLTIKRQEAA